VKLPSYAIFHSPLSSLATAIGEPCKAIVAPGIALPSSSTTLPPIFIRGAPFGSTLFFSVLFLLYNNILLLVVCT
jgi:hypothetical protein